MIRVLIVGTGGMANQHAEAYAAMDGVQVVAGVDPNAQNLHAFNAKHGITHAFDDIKEAIKWGDFDAVCWPFTIWFLNGGKRAVLVVIKHTGSLEVINVSLLGRVTHFW